MRSFSAGLPWRLSGLLLCQTLHSAGAMWENGYPKLQFGSQALSPDLDFPSDFGAQPAIGKVPQQLIFRFKVRTEEDARAFEQDTVIQIHLSDFVGGDNAWTSGDAVKFHSEIYVANGIIQAVSHFSEATWKAASNALTIRLNAFPVGNANAEIKESEYLVVLNAGSFRQGNGPITPSCLRKEAPIYIASFTSGGIAHTEFRSRFGMVSAVGCFGDSATSFGIEENQWITKSIGQDPERNGLGIETTITVTLASKLDLSSVSSAADSIQTIIQLTGLQGSGTGDGNIEIEEHSRHLCSIDGKFTAGGIVNMGVWERDLGRLTLTITDDSTLPAGIPFVFQFKLSLPVVAQESPEVSISLRTGATYVIEPQPMMKARGDAAPLKASTWNFLTASIGQSVSGPGQGNTITITLKTNFDMQSTITSSSIITISGLVGFITPDSSTENKVEILPVSVNSVDGFFTDSVNRQGQANFNLARWNKEAGTLRLALLRDNILRGGTEYVFAIRLTNPFELQSSPSVYLESSGALATEKIAMDRDTGFGRPLFITHPTITMAKMGQSSSGAGALNTLTLTLQSNVGVQTVEDGSLTGRVSITGLQGFTDSNGAIPLINKGFTEVAELCVGQSGVWSKGDATMVLELSPGKQLQAGTVYLVAFTMRNPNIAQASPEISIEVSGLQNVQVQRVRVEKAAGSAAPLLISDPAFRTAAIGQRSSGPEVVNQLTVTLAANLRLSESMRVTISGLLGSGTLDNPALDAVCGGSFKSPVGVVNKAKWTQSTGSLELLVANGLEERTQVICSFMLLNPGSEQDAIAVTISVNSFASGQVTNIIPSTTMRNAPGNAGPFFVRRSTFLTASIGQSKPYPGEDSNLISVTLKANVALASVGSIVATLTLSGLTGSRTEDSSQMVVDGEDPLWTQITGSRGTWTQASGTLVLTIEPQQNLRANHAYVFSFQLSNPFDAHGSPDVSVSTSGGEQIPAMAVSKDTSGCIHQQGDAAPLFVYNREFLTKKIGMRTTTRQGINVISVTIRSSVSLSSIVGSQTSITISGLVGLATPDNNALPIKASNMDVLGDSAEWKRDTGTLLVAIQTGRTMDSSSEYQIDVDFTNGVDLVSPAPTITASSISTIIPSTAMDFHVVPSSALFSVFPQSGSTAVSLRLSFTATTGISSGDQLIILLPGFQGTDTSSSNQIWGVTSSPPAFTVESDASAFQDSTAAGFSTARARFRAGFTGRTPRASSSADGEPGSTIVMDTRDLRLFGRPNEVAGSTVRIDGSPGHHQIFRQTPAAVQQEGVAHVHPKYVFGGEAEHVPKGATYSILPQLELTARSHVCSGTRVVIEIPISGQFNIPENGIPDGTEVWLSHVKAGIANSATIGTLFTIEDAGVRYSGSRGREVEVQLESGAFGMYEGYAFQPTMASVPGFVYVDGFRLLSQWDVDTAVAKLFTGYGPKKETKLKTDVTHGTLDHRKSLPADDADFWLQLADLTTVRPSLTKANEGAFLQIGQELLRFTGDLAKGVESFTDPEQPGGLCRVSTGGAPCSTADNCLLLLLDGCEDPPTATVEMDATGVIRSVSVNYGGACKAGQTPRVRGDIIQADGVDCDADPRCGTGCVAALVAQNNMIKAHRAQLGTTPAALAASALAPSTARVQPVSVYVDDGAMHDLLYTSNEEELDSANEQTLRVRYNRNVQSVAAGDHVTAISNPETLGAGCKKGGVVCGELDICATIVFGGCPVNPKARLQFNAGHIDEAGGVLSVGTSTTFGGSLCRSGDMLTGGVALADDVVCDELPACGRGCVPTLDATRDLLLVRHEDMRDGVGVYPDGEEDYAAGDDLVRVHAPEETAYRIVLVPPTRVRLAEEEDGRCDGDGGLLADAACSRGQSTKLVDSAGNVLADVQPSDCRNTVCAGLSFATAPDGTPIAYPASCLQSCNITGLGGFPIGSDKVVVEVQSLAAPGTPLLRLVLAITYNVDTAPDSASRRLAEAPDGYEFRINADCDCMPSTGGSVECDVFRNGEYQALLVPLSRCASPAGSSPSAPTPPPATTPPPALLPPDATTSSPLPAGSGGSSRDVGALVGGVVGGLLAAFLLATILFLACRPPLDAAPSTAVAEDKLVDVPDVPNAANTANGVLEGPVFVGRPVPLPPDPLLQSPRLSSSPVLPPASAWAVSPSVLQPLPSSFTPFPAPPLLNVHAPISPRLRVAPAPPRTVALQHSPSMLPPPFHRAGSPVPSPGTVLVPGQQPRYHVGVRVGPPQPDHSQRDELPPATARPRRPYQVFSEDEAADLDGAHTEGSGSPQHGPQTARVPYGV